MAYEVALSIPSPDIVTRCFVSYTRSVLVSEQDHYLSEFVLFMVVSAIIQIQLERRELLCAVSFASRSMVSPKPAAR